MTTTTTRKTNPTRVNLWLDVLMLIVFLIVFDPRLTGGTLHEWLGLAIGATVIVHLLRHWNWIAQVTKRFLGRTTAAARLNYLVDALFFVALTLIILSGLTISEVVLPFVGLSGAESPFWHLLHNMAASWAVALVAIHTALHWKWIVNTVRRYVLRPASVAGRAVVGRTQKEVTQ